MKKRNRKRIQVNERDLAMLLFLWQWKLGTTKAMADKFFPGLYPNIAYNRLRALKNAKFIQVMTTNAEGTRFVWALTAKGFHSLKERLPELREDGFKSEYLEHDFYVTALHLGDWLAETPANVAFFTEQELRRYKLEHYPDWIPRTELHRPDGYWQVPYNGKLITIALEVELNKKEHDDYEAAAHFYKDRPQIFRVIWIVSSPALATHIQTIFRDSVKNDSLKHDFAILKDCERLSWQAPIMSGYEQGKTISYVLGSENCQSMGRSMGQSIGCPLVPMDSPCLDTRKYPGDSRNSTNPQKPLDRNWMAYRPSPSFIQLNTKQATVNVHITESNGSVSDENTTVPHGVTHYEHK